MESANETVALNEVIWLEVYADCALARLSLLSHDFLGEDEGFRD